MMKNTNRVIMKEKNADTDNDVLFDPELKLTPMPPPEAVQPTVVQPSFDIVNKKCASDPLFGAPHCISTVDEYQGSQNDFVLLSLVRTRSVGHLRDVRRLIVALSRAKYGLYVFAKTPLFEECAQLTKAFDLLTQRPQQLRLLTNESYPTKRALNDTAQYEQVTNIAHFMTIVNRMADAKRDHAQNEYKQQMMQYISKEHCVYCVKGINKINKKRSKMMMN
eukprot:463385_1